MRLTIRSVDAISVSQGIVEVNATDEVGVGTKAAIDVQVGEKIKYTNSVAWATVLQKMISRATDRVVLDLSGFGPRVLQSTSTVLLKDEE